MADSEGIVKFDVHGLRDFLLANIRGQRVAKQGTTYDVGSADYVAGVLTRYINHARRTNTYLVTNHFRPPTGMLAVQVMVSDDVRRLLRAPVVHLAQDSGVIRILQQEFHEWLGKEGLPIRSVIDALAKHGGMVKSRPTWAAMTEWASSRMYSYEINLKGGPMPSDAVGNYFNFGTKNLSPTQHGGVV